MIKRMVNIDELDKKLIIELQKKANTPLHEIAKKLDTSVMTCLLYTSPSPRD